MPISTNRQQYCLGSQVSNTSRSRHVHSLQRQLSCVVRIADLQSWRDRDVLKLAVRLWTIKMSKTAPMKPDIR